MTAPPTLGDAPRSKIHEVVRHRCTSFTMLAFIQSLVVTTENSLILYQHLIP
ncbi:hypothetical protein COO91_09637 (plasmid) [Nostoc flagelliforme CCNUN1]|uniref:Uncharacterized protein n=1 Tax=Nostoc flagelliforme CCNUN1 TaxID=2038116 RepID=A0A2K8T6X5_9NOSO|nr:hypothetical protein COO91_09637 [Nostoc flagelliforme CCNUN1]